MAVHISIRVWYIPEALSGGYFWNTFNLKGYHIGNALWVVMATGAIQVYGVSCIFRSALFYELAKWRRLIRFIWLQKKSSKVFAIQAVSRIEYVTLVDDSFRRSLLLSGKFVGWAHFVNTLRLCEASPILGVLYSCTKTVCSTRI